MSLERLTRLRHAAVQHDPEVAAWLDAALQAWRNGEDLDCALGLAGTQAVRARNAAIRRAADLLDREGALSAWARAGRVEAAVRHYEAVVWPRRGSPRATDSPLKLAMHEWLTLEGAEGVRPVRVQRALYNIVRTE